MEYPGQKTFQQIAAARMTKNIAPAIFERHPSHGIRLKFFRTQIPKSKPARAPPKVTKKHESKFIIGYDKIKQPKCADQETPVETPALRICIVCHTSYATNAVMGF